jgi:uncharacterized protein YbjT (DUF2867 family)
MAGADVVVDVSNAPAWSDEKVMWFFTTVTRNALEAGRRAGARHDVALSILGCEQLPESGYMRAKVAQEQLIKESGVPFTIVHSTQFMEFLRRIADDGASDDVVRVPDAAVQPIAAAEVARFVADVAVEPNAYGTVEVAGPEAFAFEEAIARTLIAASDSRRVVKDVAAPYFGTTVRDGVLLPGPEARIATTRLATWLAVQNGTAIATV